MKNEFRVSFTKFQNSREFHSLPNSKSFNQRKVFLWPLLNSRLIWVDFTFLSFHFGSPEIPKSCEFWREFHMETFSPMWNSCENSHDFGISGAPKTKNSYFRIFEGPIFHTEITFHVCIERPLPEKKLIFSQNFASLPVTSQLNFEQWRWQVLRPF